jgi:hypothetical protein
MGQRLLRQEETEADSLLGDSKMKTGERLAHAAPTGRPGLTATKGNAQTGIRTSARSESGRERRRKSDATGGGRKRTKGS